MLAKEPVPGSLPAGRQAGIPGEATLSPSPSLDEDGDDRV